MKMLLRTTLAALVLVGCKHGAAKGTRLGCFVDKGEVGSKSPDRLLDGARIDARDMTVEKCVSECKKNSFTYAGVEHSTSCFCGNSYGKYEKKPDSDCGEKCGGDPNETCGGGWRIELYETK